jgi:hypothetical protein
VLDGGSRSWFDLRRWAPWPIKKNQGG